MFSERTRNIAREQVRCKIQDAKQRTLEAMQECMDARNEAEYNVALEKGVKAAQDYEVWRKVLDSL